MAGQLIKTGGNSQKTVFTMLIAILLLEFGSLSKLNKIWGLAFKGDTSQQQSQGTPESTPANNNNGVVQLVQVTPTHPTSNNNPVVTL